jgi:TolB-like protein
MARFGPKSLFRELRRRRVFNTIAIYIVGAWAALQVAELALPALNIPDRAIRYVWLASFALFPLVLLFGWRYDISTGGIHRTPPGDMPPDTEIALSGGDRWYVGVLSLLGLAVVAAALVRIAQTGPEAPPLATITDLSVAVLPFEVCEDERGHQLLAGALSEELRNRLAERSPLQIMLRTSTDLLAGSGLPPAEIARRLDVQYLVSGVMCRNDGVLAISAELRDRDNTIMDRWTHQQGINDFDQIVMPLATQVADGVATALGVRLDQVTDTPVNQAAYEAYLLSRDQAWSGEFEEAMEVIGQALELEPDFAEAIAWQVVYSVRQIHNGPPEEAYESGRNVLDAVDRLVAYEQNNAHIQFAAGIINFELERFAQAEKHFRAARTLNPALTGFEGLNVHGYLGDTLVHLGADRRSEALEVYEDALAADPWNPRVSASLARWRAEYGRYREAIELLDRYRQLPEVPAHIWHVRRQIVLSHGYYDEDCETQLWIRENELGKLAPGLATRQDYIDFFTRVLTELGLRQEAGAALEIIGSTGRPASWANASADLARVLRDEQIPERGRDDLTALALVETGEEHRAAELLEASWATRGPGWWNKQPAHEAAAVPMLLVELLFVTKRADDAGPILEGLRQRLENEHGMGNRHPQTLRFLAEVHAYQGREKEALNMLDKAVDYHLRDRDLDSDNRPYSPWAPMRDDPRFTTQMNRMLMDLEQQADTVRTMLSRYDLDDLLAPLKSAERNGDE